ncbi:hypothetical protein PENSUB_5763 [Penicillium subrubescens]|uniref:Uncharacterized protein n=1 Tax=Penicillium subrubescens TaxID=1316194 RepID=A0A1Q5U5X4_9EURO|nr:hypothetical protein PENSUB_5763 [Penicillium subrubescens]
MATRKSGNPRSIEKYVANKYRKGSKKTSDYYGEKHKTGVFNPKTIYSLENEGNGSKKGKECRELTSHIETYKSNDWVA